MSFICMVKTSSKFDQFVLGVMRNSFNFLIADYDCRLVEERISYTRTDIVYKNKATGVTVGLDQRMGAIMVDIIRLVDGELPHISDDDYSGDMKTVHAFDFENILKLKAPEAIVERPSIEDLLCHENRETVISEMVEKHAKVLKKYGRDVLSGDIHIFDKIAASIRKMN